jgi:anthranilate phosphoribosyltransferase
MRFPPPKCAPCVPTLLARIMAGEDLASDEAEAAFGLFMDGTATPVQMAALLVALGGKGLAPSEVVGGVRALRRAMVPVAARDPGSLVDTAGTGGGEITTFNISTAAALVAAGAGVRLAKHGNRSFVAVRQRGCARGARGEDRPRDGSSRVGIVFMFAPILHPRCGTSAPSEGLGITTIMNVLGPDDPAGARRQVVGVPTRTSSRCSCVRCRAQHRGLVVQVARHGQAVADRADADRRPPTAQWSSAR